MLRYTHKLSLLSIRSYSSRNFSLKIDPQRVAREHGEKPVEHLIKRGLLETISDDAVKTSSQLKLYCGADPTAKSLHLGNLLPLFVLLHFNLRGHDVVAIVGGATGRVGDPSGRLTERAIADFDEQSSNVSRIMGQLSQFFKTGKQHAEDLGAPKIASTVKVLNNYSWWSKIGFLDFLAEYGRHIRVNSMLARDSVKSRLSSESGIGFNEFTYQVLQAFDFWHLYKEHGVDTQVGGNDQWGNITAGIDLISRLKKQFNNSKPAFGITVPLLVTAAGQKFGKSMGNAVFIDKNVTPSFEMYNYFMKAQDSEVAKLLKMFTFVPLEQIEELMEKHQQDSSSRIAQRVLADEVTTLIHGEKELRIAKAISSVLYPLPHESYPEIDTNELLSMFDSVGLLKTVEKEKICGKRFSEVLSVVSGCSKREARKTVENGGLYFGFDRQRVDPSDSVVVDANVLIDGKMMLLRIGKSNYRVVSVV